MSRPQTFFASPIALLSGSQKNTVNLVDINAKYGNDTIYCENYYAGRGNQKNLLIPKSSKEYEIKFSKNWSIKKSLNLNYYKDDIINELSENLLSRMEETEAELGRPLTETEQETILREHGDPMVVASRYGATHRCVSFGRQLIGPALFPIYIIFLKLTGIRE